MKTEKKFFENVLLILLVMSACSKDATLPSGWNLKNLHADYTKSWKLVEYYVDNVSIAVPAYAMDNIFVFNYDGTAVIIFGEIDLSAQDTIKCDHFNWQLWGDSLVIEEVESTHSNGKVSFNILKLTDSYWSYQYMNKVTNELITAVYVPVIFPNSDAGVQNKQLTHGLSKFWKVRETILDGQPYNIPEWRKDDLFLFNTDGTGYFTFGENVEFLGDTTNNDHFHWWFENNYSRLELEEFSQNSFEIADCNIITLTDTLMIVEEQVMINGVMTLVRVTRVPAVK